MSQLTPDWVILGYLTSAHGIKGALSYKLLHADSDCLREGLEIALVSPRWVKRIKINQILSADRLMLMGIHDRTEAEKLAKTEIWVRRVDFQELPEDEVYLADLIGFDAFDLENKSMGQVTGFSDNRAQILVEIDHKTLIPFVKPILVKIDEQNKKIILDFHDAD
ncbi:MAG: ribosome maturation factor RimM [Myxococcaceae bacterium]